MRDLHIFAIVLGIALLNGVFGMIRVFDIGCITLLRLSGLAWVVLVGFLLN